MNKLENEIKQSLRFGSFIKRIRKSRGLTLLQVAKALGVTSAYICDIEHGRRGKNLRPKTLLMLADYLNVPHNMMFIEAGVKDRIDDPRLSGIYRAIRNRSRAERIVRALTSMESNLGELKDLTEEMPYRAIKCMESLESSLKELNVSIEA